MMYGPTFQDKFEAKMSNNIEPLTMAALGLGAYGLGKGISGYFSGRGAGQAARTQARSATEAMGTLQDLYGQAGQQFQPYQQAGAQGLEALTSGVMGGQFQTDVPQFQFEEFDFQADPGYQFRQEQGQQAIERGAAARGGALGGGTLKALEEYSQGLASQEYGKAYGRFAGERQFDYGLLSDLYGRQVQQKGIQYGGLAGLAGMGQQAAGAQAGLLSGLGGNLAGLITDRGTALGAGQQAKMEAYGDVLGGIPQGLGSLAMGAGLQGYMFPGGGAGGGRLPLPLPNQGLPIG